jgi:hypothetical protein
MNRMPEWINEWVNDYGDPVESYWLKENWSIWRRTWHSAVCITQIPRRLAMDPNLHLRGIYGRIHFIISQLRSLLVKQNKSVMRLKWLFQFPAKLLFDLTDLALSQKYEKQPSASSCLSVRLFVRLEQLGSQWTDFNEIWYFSMFRKSVEKIQGLLKFDKNNGYFT